MLGSASASTDEPPMPGHVEVLLGAMQAAGVSGALVVQPANHMYDHTYLNAVLAAHPGKLAGCCLADPTPGVRVWACVGAATTDQPQTTNLTPTARAPPSPQNKIRWRRRGSH
jgi:hypothetical protein